MSEEEAIKRLEDDISAGEYSTTKTEVLETVLQALKNSIPKEVIKEAVKEIERSKNLSSMLIEEKVIIADNGSLYKGQEIAHENEALGDYQMENFEVIGNTTDNSELLKEE